MQQLELTIRLSIPAVVAQISYIVMQYIDASMVGSLGAEASASIGLVSTSTWLFWGVCVASATGFSVQVAHHIGAKEFGQARAVLRQSFVATTIFSLLLTVIGVLVSTPLPAWLGGDVAIQYDASSYFLIFILVLQQFDGNILGPKILGNSTGLSAFWVVTSILLGGGLFGFVGMVMGVPTFAVIYYIVDMILDNKLKKKKLPVRSDSYDEWSYVDSSGEYIHSEEIKSKAEEK